MCEEMRNWTQKIGTGQGREWDLVIAGEWGKGGGGGVVVGQEEKEDEEGSTLEDGR